jgi:hypothetical protein
MDFTCSLVNDAVSSWGYVVSNGRTISEHWIQKDFERRVNDLIGVLSRQLSGGTEKKHEKSVMIIGVPAEFGTEYLLTDGTNLLGVSHYVRVCGTFRESEKGKLF